MKASTTRNPILLIWLAIGLWNPAATTAQAQFGSLNFVNTPPARYITNGVTMQKVTGSNYKVSLYYGANPNSLTAAATASFSPVSGVFNGGLLQLPPYNPGDEIYVQLRSWYPATYSSYEQAMASGDPTVVAGVSAIAPKVLGDNLYYDNVADLCGFYLQPVVSLGGSLQVTITPAGAVSAGAQWRVDNGSWQNSGATVSGLLDGPHGVNFKTVSGWLVPETQNMSVWVYANQTTTVTGVYPQSGLQVFISPASAGGSALWRVDGGSWYPAGVAIGISAGTHTVNFMPLSGWNTPANLTATCNAGAVCAVTGAYTPNAAITLNAGAGGGNNGIGMNLTGTAGERFVVEASTNMVHWVPLQTNTLTSGPLPFNDPQWTNFPGRFYRLHWQ